MGCLKTELFQLMREDESIFNFIQDAALDGLWYLNLLQLEEEWMNPRLWKTLGYMPEEIPEETHAWKRKVVPEDFETAQNIVSNLQSGAQTSAEATIRFFHKQGHTVWLRARAIVICNERQVPMRLLGVLTDITELKQAELAQKLQNEQYAHVVDGSEIGTWAWNVQTGETRYNEQWANLLGYKLADLSPTSDHTFITRVHPDDLKRSQERLQAHFDGLEPVYACEIRLKHREGHWIWVQDKGKLVTRTQDGRPEWIAGSHIDITEARKALDRNKLFIELAPSAIAMFDKDMRYLAVSARWISDYDLPDANILGKSHYEVFPEITDTWKAYHEAALRGAVMSKERDAFKRMNGKTQWLNWEIRPWYDLDGALGGILMYTQDVSQQMHAEEQLRISEEIFRRNFEYAAIGMSILNKYGKWLLVNRALCDMLGYTETELRQKTYLDITHPEDVHLDVRYNGELVSGKRKFFHLAKRYIHKQGHTIHVLIAVSAVRDELGELLYYTGQIIDLSEQKKAEQQASELIRMTQEQNGRLRNFAHIVSHNLRSHSGNFRALLDLYFMEHPNQTDDDILKNLVVASENLQETITHLNEVVLMNDATSDSLANYNMKVVIHKAIQSISALANESRVKIINQVTTDQFVRGVAAYLDSIVINLLTNGIKYKNENVASYIRIYCENQADYIILAFEDNGLGIDLNLHGNKIFGMYKTFHKHKDAKGVGLFITKNQIESMGGRITVESEPNAGSTFKIYLKHGEH